MFSKWQVMLLHVPGRSDLTCRKGKNWNSEINVICTVPLFLTNSFIPDNKGCWAASTDLLTVNDNWIAIFWDLRCRKKQGNKPKTISSTSDDTAQVTQSPTSKSDASLWTSFLWTRLHRFTNWFNEHYIPNILRITPQTFLWTFGKRT